MLELLGKTILVQQQACTEIVLLSFSEAFLFEDFIGMGLIKLFKLNVLVELLHVGFVTCTHLELSALGPINVLVFLRIQGLHTAIVISDTQLTIFKGQVDSADSILVSLTCA